MMKLSIPTFLRWYPILSLVLASAFFGFCLFTYNYFKVDDRVPASVIGVHHLGSDYVISKFYIDKRIGDNVGEGGGGGGMVCCVTLPRKWNSQLRSDVRWEVHHIIRSSDGVEIKKVEITGIYHAQVPVEPYLEPGNFYVHFFQNGRVRIVVSSVTFDGALHPIRWEDTEANKTATAGTTVTALFTSEELAKLDRKAELDKKKYGDWR